MVNYDEVLELEYPHGFLMSQGKKTAVARIEPLDIEKSYLITSDGEAFGVANFGDPAQIKTKDFDSEEWTEQHRIMARERRQWWPDSEVFYIYRIESFDPFESVKLYEDGQLVDEPRLTSQQWKLVSKAKELPRQVIIDDDFISMTTDFNALCKDVKFYNRELKTIVDATFDQDVACLSDSDGDEIIPIYSLALVRNPRMRVSKKNLSQKQEVEGESMPYRIRERDGEYCVIKINPDDSDGETEKCHESREMAEAHLAALNINVVAEEEGAYDKPKKPRKKEFVEVTHLVEKGGEIPSYTISKSDGPAMWLSNDYDKPKKSSEEAISINTNIEETEIIDADTLVLKAKNPGFMNKLKSAMKTMLDIITLAETEEKEGIVLSDDYGVAQKRVNGELWHFTWSTNAFEDREREIFSTKALENYVLQAEKKRDRGYFNLWHINAEDGNFNTDFARKEWQGVVGRFLIEAGPYLDDEKGRAAKEFFNQYSEGHPEIAPEGWGCSPEFRYLPEERATGVYENIWITRTSTLPKMAAANIWTETRQLTRSKMLTEEQTKAAIALFGKEYVDNLLTEGEKRTEELEAANVAHKGNEKPAEIQLNMEELAAEVGKQFTANLNPLTEAIEAIGAELQALKKWKEKQEKDNQIKAMTESPRYVFNMTRASESGKTVVTEGDKLLNDKPSETTSANNDPWSQIFNNK